MGSRISLYREHSPLFFNLSERYHEFWRARLLRSLIRFSLSVLALPRFAKRLIVLAGDAGLCALTVWLAFYLRLDLWLGFSEVYFQPVRAAMASMLLALPIFIKHGFYRVIFRHSGLSALGMMLRAFALYAALYAALIAGIGISGVPRSVGIIQPMLLLLAVGASRALARYWLGGLYREQLRRSSLPKVLIYGAGSAGRQLAAAIANSHEMRAVGFLDDDDRLHGQIVNGLPIHSSDALEEIIAAENISTVLLAFPSASRRRRNEILERIRSARVAVRTLPNMSDLIQGRVSAADVHDLDEDDLLGREPVPPDAALLAKNVAGKVVMVTGAGGSIGSELCRQIAAIGPAKLLLVEQSEFALYTIHQELREKFAEDGLEAIPLLASVQDVGRLREIMAAWSPSTVFHAAAYKHVPLVEHNPVEGVKNNVLGTLRAAQAAEESGVADFVLISTDKAVRPTNIMGASKRLAEMVLQALAARAAERGGCTCFTMVRFGNVLGSSGSVVPMFRRQIRDGGPITLTHAEMTRYFMTIPEAAQLVIQAAALSQGGDVFLLDMGQPVKIIDLARRMVQLSGLTCKDDENPEGDIEIRITGLRPGEKLYEELLIGDHPQPTPHPRIMKAREAFLPWPQLAEKMAELEKVLAASDVNALRAMLKALVSGYTPSDGVVDWVCLEQESSGDSVH